MAPVSVAFPRARSVRLPFALAGASLLVAVAALVGNGLFAAGVLAGVVVAGVVRRGEETARTRTERELARAGTEWKDDVPNAAGAPGFVVHSGNTTYRVDAVALPRAEVAGSSLAAGRYRLPLLLDAVRGAASAAEGRLGRAVVPVLAVWGDFAPGEAVVDGVLVVRGDLLGARLAR